MLNMTNPTWEQVTQWFEQTIQEKEVLEDGVARLRKEIEKPDNSAHGLRKYYLQEALKILTTA